MKWLLLALALLCGCVAHGNLVAVQNTDPTIAADDAIRVSIVAHVRSLYDVKMTIPVMVEHTNMRLAPYGFIIDRVIYVADVDKVILSDRVSERRRLFKYPRNVPNVIHVILTLGVRSTKHQGYVSGMHVRHKQNECIEYIVLSDIVSRSTLTHEIGHIFKLGHTNRTDNIMRPGYRKGTADFTVTQRRILMDNAKEHAKKCWSHKEGLLKPHKDVLKRSVLHDQPDD